MLTAAWAVPYNDQRPFQSGDRRDCMKRIRESADGRGIRLTPKHNSWAIGKTMRDLFYLDDWNQYQDSIGPENTRERRHAESGYEMQPMVPPAHGYSQNLIAIIGDCMSLEARQRPTAKGLLRRAKAGLRTCVKDLKRAGIGADHPSVKLYFRGNEINDMPQGPHDLDKDWDLDSRYKKVVDNTYKDLRWGRLKPPYAKWGQAIKSDIKHAEHHKLWPTGEGPFRYDGNRVILLPDYALPEEASPDNEDSDQNSSGRGDDDGSEDGSDEDDSDGSANNGGHGKSLEGGTRSPASDGDSDEHEGEEHVEEAIVDESDNEDEGQDVEEEGTEHGDGDSISPPGPPPVPTKERVPCGHRCRDKSVCGHMACCKNGVVKNNKRKRD